MKLSNENLRNEIRNYLLKLRETAKSENEKDESMLSKVIFTEIRKGFYNNEYVDRLVLFLRGTGCSLATETGGCTFCGFYNATNFGYKIPDNDYIKQLNEVMENGDLKFDEHKIICLYNDGSLLKESEISFNALLTMLCLLNKKQTVQKIVIESRVEDITEEKIKGIRKTTNKDFEIAVGFESANPMIRDYCINKSFDNEVFEKKCSIAKKYKINIIPLLMLKPSFLSEKEALNDFIESLIYLETFNLRRIDVELPTVEKYTLTHELWKRNMYSPAKLWSVIEILKKKHQLNLKTPIYISPPNYSVSSEDQAHNCDKCDAIIFNAFEEYNRFADVSIFEPLSCSCKNEWVKLVALKEDLNLMNRIESYMEILTQQSIPPSTINYL